MNQSAPRPHLRDDGFPSRQDQSLQTPAERLIQDIVWLVEEMGASQALTDCVVLLGRARSRLADHVEGCSCGPSGSESCEVCGGRR